MKDLKSEVKLPYTTGRFSVPGSRKGVGESLPLSYIDFLVSQHARRRGTILLSSISKIFHKVNNAQ